MINCHCLGELIEKRVMDDKDKPFIIEPDTGKTLLFGELSLKTGKIAEKLGGNGFKKGDRVACIFQNGISSSLAFLSVSGNGGIAVPISPQNTEREFSFFLEHGGIKLILTEKNNAADILKKIPAAILADELIEGISLLKYESGDSESTLDSDAAMILYTSGTTGVPKGVILTHQNLLSECDNIIEAHKLTKDDKVLCLLPLHHINGLVVTLLTPLAVGFTVIMPPKFSASRFWNWMQNGKATWFSAVPTIYSILLSREIPDPKSLSHIRFARSASSALAEAVLGEFEERTGIPLIESYGITEGGSQITSNPLPPEKRKPGSVGLPFGNKIKIVLSDGKEAFQGTAGEVLIKGANVTKAYYKNEEATHDSFKDAWFYTGDIGFIDEDGYLFLQGRSKELINRAGEMISPREIDEILYQIPGIELAAAVGVPHELYGEEVVAFVKIRDGHVLKDEGILNFCSKKLISFKVPKNIYYIDDFPKGPSGKIQRLKLVDRYLDMGNKND